MGNEVRRAVKEIAFAAVLATVFYLFAAALFALIVKACAPPRGVVTAVNWCFKGLGAFVFSLLFVHSGRALFKGAAAGLLFALLSLFAFAAIGGGFAVTALFPVELLLCAAAGGTGALVGVKLRKES